jgi:tetratricopeptide (TPR) repeat protein
MTDLYGMCPCGSGKKFKWCCQPIAASIEKVFDLEEAGQHETALRAMDDLVKAHETNPEVWGQKAKLYYMQGNTDQAEEALEKAFTLNPKYAYGFYLRGSMRFHEGESQGALLLARRAAEAYHHEAHDSLTGVYSMIFDCEMRHNRPVAARAALEVLRNLNPNSDAAREAINEVFGPESRLPLAASKHYTLRPAQASRRPAWDAALREVTPKFNEIANAYQRLTEQDASDADAWYNLGIARAWLGENNQALEALEVFIERTTDEAAAVEAASLSEVLRCGLGMEEQCDYVQHAMMIQLTNVQAVNGMLQEWLQSRRLIPLANQEEGVISALVLELTKSGLVTVGNPGTEGGRFAAYMMISGPMMQLHCPVQESYQRLKDEIRTKLGLGLNDIRATRVPAQFPDILAEAVLFPIGSGNEEEASKRSLEHAGRFLEDTWIHRPLKSLSNISPLDAAGSAKLRRKVRGIVEFLRQTAKHGMLAQYDFAKILHKIGLSATVEASPSAAASESASGATAGTAPAISAMNAAELAALKQEELSEEQLEQAFQTAMRLDAQEIAAHFARAGVSRPATSGKPDRYAYYATLATRALLEGDTQAALAHLDAGLSHDATANEGKRRDDYGLRRANVLVQRGEAEAAEQAFLTLIERSPRNFKFRGQAAEAMLKLKQPAKALQFAQEGLKEAGQANDRDASGYMNDLINAAKRQGA